MLSTRNPLTVSLYSSPADYSPISRSQPAPSARSIRRRSYRPHGSSWPWKHRRLSMLHRKQSSSSTMPSWAGGLLGTRILPHFTLWMCQHSRILHWCFSIGIPQGFKAEGCHAKAIVENLPRATSSRRRMGAKTYSTTPW